MFRFSRSASKAKKEQQAVLESLKKISTERLRVEMEIEKGSFHFETYLALSAAVVLVAKPNGLKELKKGMGVRFELPWEPDKHLRMLINTPHFNLANGHNAFLCDAPTHFTRPSGRTAERFNTQRFNNIHLNISNRSEPFKVLDISHSGCRIHLPSPTMGRLFNLGERLPGGCLKLGGDIRVETESVVPKSLQGQTLGCQFILKQNSLSRKIMDSLLASLGRSERLYLGTTYAW